MSSDKEQRLPSIKIIADRRGLSNLQIPMQTISEKNSPVKTEFYKSFEEMTKFGGSKSEIVPTQRQEISSLSIC